MRLILSLSRATVIAKQGVWFAACCFNVALLWIGLLLHHSPAHSQDVIAVKDDSGQTLALTAPAQRIVSLAPNLTELLFSVGVGSRIVGTVDFSDFPTAAKKITRVGSYTRIDLETIIALKPDLIVAWQSGNPPASIAQIKALGIPVFMAQSARIDDIGDILARLADLTGHRLQAAEEIARFHSRLDALRQRYQQRPRLRVFYQISAQPLLTISDKQYINSVITLCGGENVFAALSGLTPAVSVESVLAARPDVIIASGMQDDEKPVWLDDWLRWPRIPAVAEGHLFSIPPDLLHRQSTRMLDGAQKMCELFERVRQDRGL